MPHPPRIPKPPQLDPPTDLTIEDTHEALFDLAYTLVQHGTDFQGNVGQGVGTSKVGPSHSKDPFTDRIGDAELLDHRVTPHPCTSCGGICYGLALEFLDGGLLLYVSKTHSFHIIFCFISQF